MAEQTGQSNHKLETQLLIECSETSLTAQQINQISQILNQPLDWAHIVKIAERNAVLPLVSWNLIQNFNSLLPSGFREDLNNNFQSHVRHNILLTGKLIEVVKLFQSNDTPVMPFKGPLLADQVYGNLALRRYSDLDILVQPDDLEKAVALLLSIGYTPMTDAYWLENIKLCLKQKKDIKFVSKENNIYIELHWRLSKPYFDVPIKPEHLWQQAEIASLGGIQVSTLSFNHLLIYLCLHGSKHAWDRLAWICDVNELIGSRKPVDWEHIFEEAAQLGCENVLGLGLYLVDKFFGLECSNPKWEKIKTDETLQTMAVEVQARIFADELLPLDISKSYLNQLKLKEKRQDRWRLHFYYGNKYLQLIFSPNELDKDKFPLPSRLTPLYYALRPVRLFCNYLGKKNRKLKM